MIPVAPFLSSAWQLLGIRGLLALGLAASTVWFAVAARSHEADAIAAEAKAAASQVTIKELRAANDQQSKAVLALAASTDALIKRIDEANVTAAAIAKTTATGIARIRAAQIPQTCDGAVQWARDEAAALAKKWGEKK